MRTDEELKQLSIDIINGKVFTDLMIPTLKLDIMLPAIFMPLHTMTAEEISHNGFIYEYYDKAITNVNGWPIFRTFCTVTMPEAAKVLKYLKYYTNTKLFLQ